MGTTPNYALPYPEPTDLVKDGAQAIEDLALAVDSAITAASQNAIINGNMMVAQRGTTFTSTGGANNDDTYTLDRWYILSDGNDTIDVTQANDAPTGGFKSIGLDVETINKKFGIAQIIEQRNCIGLIGQTVTLSFKARVSSTTKLDNVKAAIVAWSGTADTVTSDIVSAWEVEGTNPTLIANATYENTPANLGVTTSWASYSVTAAVDTASTNNIIVFIWSDVTDTTLGDFLYVTDVQLEYGSVATRFTMHGGGFQQEFAACQRYYQVIANTTGVDGCFGGYYSATVAFGVFILPVEMRTTPTFSNTTGTNYFLLASNNTTDAINTITIQASNSSRVGWFNNTEAAGVSGHALALRTNNASVVIAVSAEL